MVQERVRVNVLRARENDKRLGRPPLAEDRPKVYREFKALRKDDLVMCAIAKKLDISSKTVWMVLSSKNIGVHQFLNHISHQGGHR